MVVLQRFGARVQSLCFSHFLFFKADQPLLVPPVNLPSKMQASLRGSCQDQSKLAALPAALGAVLLLCLDSVFETMFCHRPGLPPVDPKAGLWSLARRWAPELCMFLRRRGPVSSPPGQRAALEPIRSEKNLCSNPDPSKRVQRGDSTSLKSHSEAETWVCWPSPPPRSILCC